MDTALLLGVAQVARGDSTTRASENRRAEQDAREPDVAAVGCSATVAVLGAPSTAAAGALAREAVGLRRVGVETGACSRGAMAVTDEILAVRAAVEAAIRNRVA